MTIANINELSAFSAIIKAILRKAPYTSTGELLTRKGFIREVLRLYLHSHKLLLSADDQRGVRMVAELSSDLIVFMALHQKDMSVFVWNNPKLSEFFEHSEQREQRLLDFLLLNFSYFLFSVDQSDDLRSESPLKNIGIDGSPFPLSRSRSPSL